MNRSMLCRALCLCCHHSRSARLAAVEYQAVADWLKLPAGRPQLGSMHGDIAVSSRGEVYVSVEDPQAGLQVYGPDGTFLRNVPNAPPDFHGFVIRRQPDGEFIYGVRLRGQEVVKMALDGTVALTIPASAIPDEFKVRNARSGQLALLLTGVDVAPERRYLRDRRLRQRLHPPLRQDRQVPRSRSAARRSRTASTRFTS